MNHETNDYPEPMLSQVGGRADARKTEVAKLYEEACKTEVLARRSPDSVIRHSPIAAERFQQAATLARTLAEDSTIPDEERIQYKVFALYYAAQAHKQLASVLYEQRNAEAAHAERERVLLCLSQAIEEGTAALNGLDGSVRVHVEARVREWECQKMADEVALLAAEARRMWDRREWIAALDLYRTMCQKLRACLEKMRMAGTDQAAIRITAGNLIGVTVNCSQALAMIAQNHIERGTISLDVAIDLLRHTFEAHQAANLAMDTNPEWEQFREGRAACQRNIECFLRENLDEWAPIIVAFEDKLEFLKIMKNTDIDAYNNARCRLAPRNKVFLLWAVGSFWLFALVVVLAVVGVAFRLAASWAALAIIGAIEVLLLLVGALVLRTIGELSEANFMKLIPIAARFQLRWLSALRSARPDDKNE